MNVTMTMEEYEELIEYRKQFKRVDSLLAEFVGAMREYENLSVCNIELRARCIVDRIKEKVINDRN